MPESVFYRLGFYCKQLLDVSQHAVSHFVLTCYGNKGSVNFVHLLEISSFSIIFRHIRHCHYGLGYPRVQLVNTSDAYHWL